MASSSISTPYGRGQNRYSTPTRQSFWGGESDHTLRRIVEYCDGWIPRTSAGLTPKGAVDRLRRMAEQKQRDPKSLSISMLNASADRATLAEYREAGIDELLLVIPDTSRDEILQLLDRYRPTDLTAP